MKTLSWTAHKYHINTEENPFSNRIQLRDEIMSLMSTLDLQPNTFSDAFRRTFYQFSFHSVSVVIVVFTIWPSYIYDICCLELRDISSEFSARLPCIPYSTRIFRSCPHSWWASTLRMPFSATKLFIWVLSTNWMCEFGWHVWLNEDLHIHKPVV